MQTMLPPGAFIRNDAGGRAQIHYAPGFVAPPGHLGHTLVSRTIASPNRARISPTDVERGGEVRGQPENPRAPAFLRNPGGWFRHHLYGLLGRFSGNYKRRQALAAAGDPQRGSDHQIFYDANMAAARRDIITDNPAGTGVIRQSAPQERVLAHELIHADRSQRGRTAVTPGGGALMGTHDYPRLAPGGVAGHQWYPGGPAGQDQAMEEMEEMETVGLPSAPAVNPMLAAHTLRPTWSTTGARIDPNDITENMMYPALRRAKYR
ncbi:MAG TPA: hypothetical protein VN924_25025 [Bryobacteraceae bacterium]|nr:hypothetical protein [Bryobacteraceae bacterium]